MTEMEEKMIESTEETGIGTVRIAADVVATIAGLAAADVSGIAGMSGGISSGFAEMLGRKQLTKGVKVEVTEQEAQIDLFIIVEYGISIANAARKVQEAVKEAVENMTGLACKEVNIHVQGVVFPAGHPSNPATAKAAQTAE